MLDKRIISAKHNNPNNERKIEDLDKRVLKNYSDETSSSILGFNKLIYHPEKLVGLKNNTNAFPLTATLSLGNYCNHGCLWCSTAYFREAEANKINYEKISNWLEKASARGLKGVGYVGNGEPLAFKMFGELATKIGGLGLDQGIFTNGYLIDRFEDVLLEHFTYIRISLDAGSKEVHAWGHDVPESHFEKIIANLEHVIAKRKDGTPTVGVQYATHQHNIDDLENCARICQILASTIFLSNQFLIVVPCGIRLKETLRWMILIVRMTRFFLIKMIRSRFSIAHNKFYPKKMSKICLCITSVLLDFLESIFMKMGKLPDVAPTM